MKQRTRQKLQLIVNIVLTVFTLFALTISLIAWFSTRKYAEITSINLNVERQTISVLEYPESYLFPCATKLSDVRVDDFNKYTCVTGTYVIKGTEKVYVDIQGDDGVLGYVLKDSDTTDYYQAILDEFDALKGELVKDKLIANEDTELSDITDYDTLKKVMYKINTSQKVGIDTNEDNNIEVKIVCWVEYDSFDDQLNDIDNGIYPYKEIKDFNVDVMFIA